MSKKLRVKNLKDRQRQKLRDIHSGLLTSVTFSCTILNPRQWSSVKQF